jgi:hypothetical protein
MNLQTGQLEEHENLLPTPESVYKMSDPDWTVQALKDDLALNLFLYAQGNVSDLDMSRVRKLATLLRFDGQGLDESPPPRLVIEQLLDRYGFAATKKILGKVKDFTDRKGKRLLVVLFDPARVLRPLLGGKLRYDQEIVDFLKSQQFRFFDMNLVHVEDYKNFRLPIDQYMKRYLFGHYRPVGNHFFAYAIKDTVIDWLDPKPVTYQNQEDRWITFDGYLRK